MDKEVLETLTAALADGALRLDSVKKDLDLIAQKLRLTHEKLILLSDISRGEGTAPKRPETIRTPVM